MENQEPNEITENLLVERIILKGLLLGKIQGIYYLLYRSTKEETDELTEMCKTRKKDEIKYPFIKYLDACGHISEVFNTHVKEYIPITSRRKEPVAISKDAKQVYTEGFMCYASNNRIKSNSTIIVHEDPLSAFKCACSTLNIEYFYVLKIKIDEPKPRVSDSNRDTEIRKESEDVGETTSEVL